MNASKCGNEYASQVKVKRVTSDFRHTEPFVVTAIVIAHESNEHRENIRTPEYEEKKVLYAKVSKQAHVLSVTTNTYEFAENALLARLGFF
jgi:hypothetical protein